VDACGRLFFMNLIKYSKEIKIYDAEFESRKGCIKEKIVRLHNYTMRNFCGSRQKIKIPRELHQILIAVMLIN